MIDEYKSILQYIVQLNCISYHVKFTFAQDSNGVIYNWIG